MKKSIWCILDIHKWFYKTETDRKCKRCHKTQTLIDAGMEASGMTSISYWKTVK